jgi:hypothetical protein
MNGARAYDLILHDRHGVCVCLLTAWRHHARVFQLLLSWRAEQTGW